MPSVLESPIDLQSLKDERKRLKRVVEEARSANKKLDLLNKVIALYAPDEEPEDLIVEGSEEAAADEGDGFDDEEDDVVVYRCLICNRDNFASPQGLATHTTRVHGRK